LHVGRIDIIDDTPGGNIIAYAGIERLWIVRYGAIDNRLGGLSGRIRVVVASGQDEK